MLCNFNKIKKSDLKNWIIVKFIRLLILGFCIGVSFIFALLLGKGNNGFLVGLGTNSLIRELKDEKILPEDFMNTDDFENKLHKVIVITICVLAVIMMIFSLVLLFIKEG